MNKKIKPFQIVIGILLMVIGGFMLWSSVNGSPFANKEKVRFFDGAEIFYTSNITEKEVDKLGSYLIKSQSTDGTRKTFRLDYLNQEKKYMLRMVVMPEFRSPEHLLLASQLAKELSENVFEGREVSLQFCDEYLNPVLTVLSSKSIKAQDIQ